MAVQAIDTPFQIQSWLLDAGYLCYAVEQVYGGNVNFTFRGALNHPLKDGTRSIILKQSRGFMAVDTALTCPLHRCVEELILCSLSKQRVISFHENVLVRTPRHYGTLLRHDSYLQIMEELPATRPLKDLLHCPEKWLSAAQATAMGHALGKWLSGFHGSGCDGRDPVLATALRENNWPRDEIFPMVDAAVEKHVRDFPHLFDEMKGKTIRARAEAAFMMVEENGLALRHGDVSMSNIVVSADSSGILLGVIDWESCHYGRRQHDLAMFLAGLISVECLCHTGVGTRILNGVMHSYPVRSEDSAFCIAAALGTWLFMWPWWCSPPPPSSGATRDIEELVVFARDLVVKGLERDRRWLKDTVLAPLFDGVEPSEM